MFSPFWARRARAALSRGAAHLGKGDLASAERRFRRAAGVASGLPASHRDSAGDILAVAAQIGLGRVWLRRATLARSAVDGTTVGDSAVGDSAVDNTALDRAEEAFREAHRLNEAAWAGVHWLGCAAAHRAEFARAEDTLTRALALGTAQQRARSLTQRGFVRLAGGERVPALADLLTAVRLGARDALPCTRALLAEEGAVSGVTLGSGGLFPGPEVAVLLRRLALDATDREDFATASSLFTTAREVNPSGVDRHAVLLEAVVHILGGQRDTATSLLRRALQHHPDDTRLLHTLAVAHLHAAPTAGEPTTAARRCIAAWGGLMYDEEFWKHWLTRAEARYQTSLDRCLAETARDNLIGLLRDRLATGGEPEGTEDADSPALLRRELDAASLLLKTGGLPRGDGATVVRGPLGMAELGLERAFGGFMAHRAHVTGRHERDTVAASLRRLRTAYSRLGLIRVEDRPAEALELLTDLRCPTCRAQSRPRGRGRADTPAEPKVCADECARFAVDNPAYAAASGRRLLRDDAVLLTIDAHLRLATTAITTEDPAPQEAATHWGQAVAAAGLIERDVGGDITETAVGRATTLQRRGKRDLAVAILEAALTGVGDGADDRLRSELALHITDRAVRAINKDPGAAENAASDLRRAVALAPDRLRGRLNLVKALNICAGQRFEAGDTQAAIARTRDSVAFATEGRELNPRHQELEQLWEHEVSNLAHMISTLAPAAIRAELEAIGDSTVREIVRLGVAEELTGKAIHQANANSAALDDPIAQLRVVTNLADGHRRSRRALGMLLRARCVHLAEQGRLEAAIDSVEESTDLLQGDPDPEARFEHERGVKDHANLLVARAIQVANAATTERDLDWAIADLQEALRLFPNVAGARLNLALVIRLRAARFLPARRAVPELERALEVLEGDASSIRQLSPLWGIVDAPTDPQLRTLWDRIHEDLFVLKRQLGMRP